jgi:hypothetical protein
MLVSKANWVGIIIAGAIILKVISPGMATGSSPENESTDESRQIAQEISAIIPLSVKMVDEATAGLADGLSALSTDQRAAFLRLYDPSETGEVDDEFVAAVVDNYEKIGDALEREIVTTYESSSDMCEGKRLYYTDLVKIHVCPYFNVEDNVNRKARALVHEITHKALLVTDRHYFRPTSKAYLTLTPKGPWTAQLPIVGKLFRELAHSDTLFHPDAYAHFAVATHTGDYRKITG